MSEVEFWEGWKNLAPYMGNITREFCYNLDGTDVIPTFDYTYAANTQSTQMGFCNTGYIGLPITDGPTGGTQTCKLPGMIQFKYQWPVEQPPMNTYIDIVLMDMGEPTNMLYPYRYFYISTWRYDGPDTLGRYQWGLRIGMRDTLTWESTTLYSDYVNIQEGWVSSTGGLSLGLAFQRLDDSLFTDTTPPNQRFALIFMYHDTLMSNEDVVGDLPGCQINHNYIWSPNAGYSLKYLLIPKLCAFLGCPGPVWEDGSDQMGPESEEGGSGVDGDNPTFDDTSDTIELPGDPPLGVSNVGFVRVYNTGVQSLIDLGVELFPPLAYTNPTPIAGAQSTTDAIIDGFNSLITFFANVPSFFDQIMANTLINYVIDCHIIPVSPGAGTTEAIKVGYKTLQVTGGRIYNDYANVSCGSIYIGGYYANFADYLTTAKLYLPLVGFVPVRPEWFQNDTLKVDYKFNVIDGSFTCYVRSGGRFVNNGDSTGTIVGQYGGNACIHLPITGVTYANMVSGLVGAGAGMAVGAASGNIAAAATSAIGAAGVHGDIAQSNAYTGSAAFLGCRYPFLMIERPVSSYARNYQHEIGLPSNIYAKLSQVSGFVKMENVHVDGITGATDEEKEEIRRLLASGVIV